MLDPAWVEETFSKINLLVLEGDAAGLAEHVSRLAGARELPNTSGARVAT